MPVTRARDAPVLASVVTRRPFTTGRLRRTTSVTRNVDVAVVAGIAAAAAGEVAGAVPPAPAGPPAAPVAPPEPSRSPSGAWSASFRRLPPIATASQSNWIDVDAPW